MTGAFLLPALGPEQTPLHQREAPAGGPAHAEEEPHGGLSGQQLRSSEETLLCIDITVSHFEDIYHGAYCARFFSVVPNFMQAELFTFVTHPFSMQ